MSKYLHSWTAAWTYIGLERFCRRRQSAIVHHPTHTRTHTHRGKTLSSVPYARPHAYTIRFSIHGKWPYGAVVDESRAVDREESVEVLECTPALENEAIAQFKAGTELLVMHTPEMHYNPSFTMGLL